MAYLFPSEKIMLLHCPKTGGTWARTALARSGYNWEHMPWTVFFGGIEEMLFAKDLSIPLHTCTHRAVDPPDRTWSVITIERDVVDWYESYFLHRLYRDGKNICEFDYRLGIDYDKGIDVFPVFVGRIRDEFPDGFLGKVFAAYRRKADFVVKTESLESHLRLFFPRLRHYRDINMRVNQIWHAGDTEAKLLRDLEVAL